ncbi:MAG: helix-turn-helix transcriptional regulator [Synergistaceae bacterium]|nr:helix-turn-helix transcriptional regulator [Synergistaceae bacterium]
MTKGMRLIVLDEPTGKFLSALRSVRHKAGMSQRETARAVNIKKETYQMYELGLNRPSLERLMRLAEYFGYDLSESVNYKVFHGKIQPCSIKRELRRYGLSYRELSEQTGYTRDRICHSVRMNAKGSIKCLFAVLEVIRQEQEMETFRRKYCLK